MTKFSFHGIKIKYPNRRITLKRRHIAVVFSIFAVVLTGCSRSKTKDALVTIQATTIIQEFGNIKVPAGSFGEIRKAGEVGLTESMNFDVVLDSQYTKSEQFDAYLFPVPPKTKTRVMRQWVNEYYQPLQPLLEASAPELLAFIKANPGLNGPVITSYVFTIKNGADVLLYAVRRNSLNTNQFPKWEIRGMNIPLSMNVSASHKRGDQVIWNDDGYPNRYYLAVGNRRFN